LRIKTDENIAARAVQLLRNAGHDVATVYEQALSGSSDQAVYQICCEEDRVLITLDRDFGQVQRFPPKDTAGIVVLELGGAASIRLLHARITEFLTLAETRPVSGTLWIVEPGRVRVHLEKEDGT
jgi:predicted nuclease of predicted toxin-antitoxin system